jgi:glucose-1-phosphate thymidylyltransferase
MEERIGLIPAAGRAERLQGLCFLKELLPVVQDGEHRPVAQFTIDAMLSAGAKELAVVISPAKHQILAYLGAGERLGCSIGYVVQRDRPRDSEARSPGLETALDSAYHLVRGKTVLFGMPDTIVEPPTHFEIACQALSTEPADVILGLVPTSEPWKFGMVQCDEKGRVERVYDKPTGSVPTNEMWAFIVWRPEFTEFLHDAVESGAEDFSTVLNNAVDSPSIRMRGLSFAAGSYSDLGTWTEIERVYRKLYGGG